MASDADAGDGRLLALLANNGVAGHLSGGASSARGLFAAVAATLVAGSANLPAVLNWQHQYSPANSSASSEPIFDNSSPLKAAGRLFGRRSVGDESGAVDLMTIGFDEADAEQSTQFPSDQSSTFSYYNNNNDDDDGRFRDTPTWLLLRAALFYSSANEGINWLNITLALILIMLILTTAIGNLFVIVAILIERNLRTIGNYLVISLAFADLLVACLVMPPAGIYLILDRWTLGKLLCEIWTTADVFCCTGRCFPVKGYFFARNSHANC